MIKIKNKEISVLFILTLLIVSASVLFRGMYFEQEQYLLFILTSCVFFAYLKTRSKTIEGFEVNRPLDLFVIGLTVCYIISCLFSMSLWLGVMEALKYIVLMFIYFLVRDMAYSDMRIYKFTVAIAVSAIVVAMIGIFSSAGVFEYGGAYSEGEKWINSTLQYHNAFGAYMLCGLSLIYVFFVNSKKMVSRLVTSACGYILALSLIFSFSRGAWVVFPLVLIILTGALYKKSFHRLVSFSIISFIPVILVSKFYYDAMVARESAKVLVAFAFGLLISLVLSVAMLFINYVLTKIKISPVLFSTVLVAAVLAGAVLVLFVFPQVLQSVLPADIAARLMDINFSSGTVQERFVFYKDALKLIAHRPVFGGGGNAWDVASYMYQSYGYASDKIHSFIFQVWAETGTVGFIVLLGMIVSYVWISILNIKSNKGNNTRYNSSVMMFTAGMALLVHSFIDFNMSLMGISIVFWSIMGLTTALSNGKKLNIKNVHNLVFMIVSMAILVVSVSFKISDMYYLEGGEAFNAAATSEDDDSKTEGFTRAALCYEKAIMFNPVNAQARENLVRSAVRLANYGSSEYLNSQKTESAHKFLKVFDSFNVAANRTEIEYALIKSDYKELEALAERHIELMPLWIDSYENYVYINNRVVDMALTANDNETAERCLNKNLTVTEKINELNESLPEGHKIQISEALFQYMQESLRFINFGM